MSPLKAPGTSHDTALCGNGLPYIVTICTALYKLHCVTLYSAVLCQGCEIPPQYLATSENLEPACTVLSTIVHSAALNCTVIWCRSHWRRTGGWQGEEGPKGGGKGCVFV